MASPTNDPFATAGSPPQGYPQGPSPTGQYDQNGQYQPGYGQIPTQYGQSPSVGSPPPLPPKRAWFKKKRFFIPLGLIVVLGVGSALSDGGADDAASGAADPVASAGTTDVDKSSAAPSAKRSSAAPVAKKPAAAPGIGAKVRDGKFEFVVTKVKSSTTIGTEPLEEKAQGKYLLVTIKVTNIGDKAQTFFGSNQKLKDSKGREFSSDDTAAIYLQDSQSFVTEINPGNAVTGIVVFDVPGDVKPAEIELHDSAFSGGKTVVL